MTDDLRPLSGLSPSSIDLYLQCPLKFRKEKLEGRSGGTGIDAVIGTAVHRALEHLMGLEPDERTLDAAKVGCRIGWAEMIDGDDFKSLAIPKAEHLALARRLWASVRNYFEMETPSEIEVLSTERKIEAVIEGVPLRGIIDRVERDFMGEVVVSDYKSGKVPQPQYAAPKLRQLNLYGAMLRAVDDVAPVEGRLLFTSFGRVISTPFTDRTLGEAIETAVGVWTAAEKARTEGFEPKTGPLCGWCPFVAECPAGLAEIRERKSKGRLKKTAPAYHLA